MNMFDQIAKASEAELLVMAKSKNLLGRVHTLLYHGFAVIEHAVNGPVVAPPDIEILRMHLQLANQMCAVLEDSDDKLV